VTEPGRALPELWGGVECTVNRVGDRWFDQLRRNGHRNRLSDVDRFASLGLQALRMPVLWESVAPAGLDAADWTWPTRRLERLRALGVRPIVGLLHHGSGPAGTNLLEEGFVEGLARFARAAAERFPWVEDWTPVNEPLTTARFSALYGHWYPHRTDAAAMARALLVQTRATVRAMEEIRHVIPGARLVQTEDMGRTTGTPAMWRQVEFENHRRWLSLDLLFGRVVPGHPLHAWLVELGTPPGQLEALARQPCPPEVVGLNYYVTSDRWLDERLDLHPGWSHGGNGRQSYADVHTSLGHPRDFFGHRAVLSSAWDRYHTPVALTEVHQGGHRADQLRWFKEAWDAAVQLRTEGVDVQAVTAWALLGSHDWNRLVVDERGDYEPGVFDIRAPSPRPTALAKMLRGLATEGRWDHPVLHAPGWWRPAETTTGPPLLVLGGQGVLGRSLAEACLARRIPCVVVSHGEVDVASEDAVRRAVARYSPWAIVNTAGRSAPGAADRNPEDAARVHVHGPEVLARAVGKLPLVSFSTAEVFWSSGARLHRERSVPSPRSALGLTRLEGERRLLASHPRALVVRIGPPFGPDVPGALEQNLLATPVYLPAVAEAVLDLLLDQVAGLLHLSHGEACTGLGWQIRCRALEEPVHPADPSPVAEASRALESGRLRTLPSLGAALHAWRAEAAAIPAARTG
jgi:dTDP-4-dehydrorhamnose reductase